MTCFNAVAIFMKWLFSFLKNHLTRLFLVLAFCNVNIVYASYIQQNRKPDPEILLIEVYKELASYRLDAAQAKANILVATYPNFRLGHLIQGDLLLMHTRAIKTFGNIENGPQDRIKNLRDEAIARLKFIQERPNSDLIPRSVLQLRNDQKHVFIIDAKRSRLYVYENQPGYLKFLADYYISQGKLGVNKSKEGDQKTPIGIYYVTSRLSSARLPDFYGSGALPINYPNEWDRLNGRSGSGIWLHGTPSDSYSRPPLSSDGCVVLTNPDLHKLFASVEIGKTPVVISDHVEFVNKSKWEANRLSANQLVEKWHQDMQSLDKTRLLANYSERFKSGSGEDLTSWFSKNISLLNFKGKYLINLKDITLFMYPGQENLIVGTFTQESQYGRTKQTTRKRQYWIKELDKWKIISEINL